MPNLYRNESSYPKVNAQRNLCGRTHYVDDDTLRFHKSKVLSSHVVDRGLLFAIVTSDSLDMDNTRRGFRYVIFNIFGTVISRNELKDAYSTKAAATKAMWAMLNSLDARGITLDAIQNARKCHEMEMERLIAELASLSEKAA